VFGKGTGGTSTL